VFFLNTVYTDWDGIFRVNLRCVCLKIITFWTLPAPGNEHMVKIFKQISTGMM